MKRTHSDLDGDSLPIYKYKAKLIETIKSHATTIVVGETGSGKLICEKSFAILSYRFAQGKALSYRSFCAIY